jgi:hypothetical protein
MEGAVGGTSCSGFMARARCMTRSTKGKCVVVMGGELVAWKLRPLGKTKNCPQGVDQHIKWHVAAVSPTFYYCASLIPVDVALISDQGRLLIHRVPSSLNGRLFHKALSIEHPHPINRQPQHWATSEES